MSPASFKFQNNQADSLEAVERQIRELVDWAQMLPHFTELLVEDQALLIHTGQHN